MRGAAVCAFSALAFAAALGYTARRWSRSHSRRSRRLRRRRSRPSRRGARSISRRSCAETPDCGTAGTPTWVFEVDPARRYERSIVEGFGNCSNMVKALRLAPAARGNRLRDRLRDADLELRGGGGPHAPAREPSSRRRASASDSPTSPRPRFRAPAGRWSTSLDLADLANPLRRDFCLDLIRPESEDWTAFRAPELAERVCDRPHRGRGDRALVPLPRGDPRRSGSAGRYSTRCSTGASASC